MGSDSGKLLADAIRTHANFEQIAQNMFDGEAKVDMAHQGLDAGDAHIMAAALEKNGTVTQVFPACCWRVRLCPVVPFVFCLCTCSAVYSPPIVLWGCVVFVILFAQLA